MFKHLRQAVVLFFGVGALFSVENAIAQSITLSAAPQSIREADDYFTDVTAEGRNFNSTCDIGRSGYEYYPSSSSNGVWTGVHPQVQAPKLEILPIPTTGTNLAVTREDCQQLSIPTERRVNAAKYRHMSWRMKNSYASTFAVLWSKDTGYSINGFSDYDGYFIPVPGGAGIQPSATQWEVRRQNLVASAPSNFPWSGSITGMTLWPSAYQPTGGNTSLDWLRLVDPDTVRTVGVTWTYSGSVPANGFVTLFVDTDNAGYDGDEFDRFLAMNGSRNVELGYLPPGTYYIYVKVGTHNTASLSYPYLSNYVGPFVVDGKPTLKFTAPTRTSGYEYSRDELGDAWDMNQLTDIVNLVDSNGNPTPASVRGLENWRVENGYFFANSIADPVGFTVDTQVHLRVGANKPIDTSYYRYFCHRYQLSPEHLPRNGDVQSLNDFGGVSRTMWMRKGDEGASFGSTIDHELVERAQTLDVNTGLVTYCFDLWDESGHHTGAKWRENRYVNVMRFDPTEARPATDFALDWAGLYAENSDTTGHQYTLKWDVADPENQSLSIGLYYDTDNSGFDGIAITTLNGQSVGSGQYVWDTSLIPAGRYYVYAVVSDPTGNTGRYYSNVIVKVGGLAGRSAPFNAPCDFDGDGYSDPSVVRAGSPYANIYTRRSRTGATISRSTGNASTDLFSAGDYDGDLIQDFGLVRNESIVRWFHTLTTDQTTVGVDWGTGNDIPLIADFNGDGVDDRAVYRPSEGNWYVLFSGNTGATVVPWGLNGDVPVPADYDGDRKADFAVFRPATGVWYIIPSAGATGVIERQFGLSGDHPMPGDVDGDGLADLRVFRSGGWYMCRSGTNFDCSQATFTQVGLDGDIPINADFDADRKVDAAVYRAAAGTYYYQRSSDNSQGSMQWGLSTDTPMCVGSLSVMQRLQGIGGGGGGGGGGSNPDEGASLPAPSVSVGSKRKVYITIPDSVSAAKYRFRLECTGKNYSKSSKKRSTSQKAKRSGTCTVSYQTQTQRKPERYSSSSETVTVAVP